MKIGNDDAIVQRLHDIERNRLPDEGEELLEQLQKKLNSSPPRHAIFLEKLKRLIG